MYIDTLFSLEVLLGILVKGKYSRPWADTNYDFLEIPLKPEITFLPTFYLFFCTITLECLVIHCAILSLRGWHHHCTTAPTDNSIFSQVCCGANPPNKYRL